MPLRYTRRYATRCSYKLATSGSCHGWEQGGIMRGTLGEILTKLRAEFEALYGPRLVHIQIYDSQARGEATPESNTEVLVVLQSPVSTGQEHTLNSYRIGC